MCAIETMLTATPSHSTADVADKLSVALETGDIDDDSAASGIVRIVVADLRRLAA
jgi:hypothetical protein